jgi:hypothetical protein
MRLNLASALAGIGFQLALAGASLGAAPDLRPIVLNASAGKIKLGEEKQLCHRLRIPRRQETEVNRIEMLVKGGSHHVHLYRPYGGPPDWPTHDCPYAVDFNKWQLVSATQNKALDWKLHPGVGILFAPPEPVLIQTHFVNATTQTTPFKGKVAFDLYRSKLAAPIEIATNSQRSLAVTGRIAPAIFSRPFLLHFEGACGENDSSSGRNGGHFRASGLLLDMVEIGQELARNVHELTSAGRMGDENGVEDREPGPLNKNTSHLRTAYRTG